MRFKRRSISRRVAVIAIALLAVWAAIPYLAMNGVPGNPSYIDGKLHVSVMQFDQGKGASTMKSTAWIVCASVALVIPLINLAHEYIPPLNVPARQVPMPNHISPELQQQLAVVLPAITPSPTTASGWKAMQRDTNAPFAKLAEDAAKLLGARVESVKIAGVNCYNITPKVIAPENEKRLLVHVHGGAFVFFGGLAATGEAVVLADACKMRVISIDYRVAPDHPFPAAPDDVFAVWKELQKDHDPKNLVMGGTSAGGTLVMTTMLRCKADNVPMPAAIFIGTPGADLSKTGDSVFVNAEVDNALGRYEGVLEACVKLYAGGRNLKDPMISPVYGDFTGWPPAILITGTRDLLLSDTVRTHRGLRKAGVPAELHVYEAQSHADYLTTFPGPESRDALGEIAKFFDKHLKR